MAASLARIISGNFVSNCQKLLLPQRIDAPCSLVAHYHLSERQGPFKQRRTLKPRRFWVKKKAAPTPDLTPDNRDFLQEVVRDQYENLSSPLKDAPWPRQEWTLLPVTKRAGVIELKLGVIPQWTKDGKRFLVTLVQVLDNHVIRYHSPEETQRLENSNRRSRSHFGSMIIGALSCDPNRLAKSYVNLFSEAGVPPKRKIAKFYISPNAAMPPGTPITINHYRVGDYVDVYGRSIGHGFQGVVKRHGFKGGPASHGNTKWHRRPGSMSGGDASKVWPGKKLPGHMGVETVNMRGLRIWRINTKYSILYLHGTGIPGPTHAYIKIRDSTLVQHKEKLVGRPPPMPTWCPEDAPDAITEEVYDETLFKFTDDSIAFVDDKKS